MPDRLSKERRAGWLVGWQAGLRFEVVGWLQQRGVDVDADVRACPCHGMADTATWNEIDSNKGKKIKAARQ
ncbi:hypothetical protein CGLO_15647 [Colletotrichum gloeosporioides Cg-14]|uniref:Uncharacterized protein n=1 Tax=Colletotrichum gloeosporioides (strain Cg-14) TaxID=1237896 RepID=T0JYI4_COLGC|nr:hypothetical protein CGLO_15647 [Colletotrichum gloeosporioides Cg-14]